MGRKQPDKGRREFLAKLAIILTCLTQARDLVTWIWSWSLWKTPACAQITTKVAVAVPMPLVPSALAVASGWYPGAQAFYATTGIGMGRDTPLPLR